jgi:hypothetical protein
MARRTTRAGRKTTVVPGGISEKAPEAIKKPKAEQKKPVPKRTARAAHLRHPVLVVMNITLTIPGNMR